MNNLWSYIEGLQLSRRNRKWLADRLIEPKPMTETNELDMALADIKEGRVLSYNSLEDLINDNQK